MNARSSSVRGACLAALIAALIGSGAYGADTPSAAPAAPAAQASSAAPSDTSEDIRDIRGPKLVVPSWMVPALLVGAVLLAVGGYVIWRKRGQQRARPLLPYEIALQRLEEIRALMSPSSAAEFSTAITDIVRSYIEQRFAVTATRQTTEEFLRDLLQSSDTALARHRALLGDFLHRCDFVKFGGMSLTSQNMEALRQSARTFVLETAKTEQESPQA
jgi:hypothetical protein